MLHNNKRATESFLVTLPSLGTMPTSGTLVDSSTGNVNVANGRLGVIAASPYGSVAMNSFVDGSPTIAEAPVIQLVQGTSASGAVATTQVKYPLWVRPFEASNPIDGRSKSITVTKQPFRASAHNIWVVGDPASVDTNPINVLDETDYKIGINFRSRRGEEMFSKEQAASLVVSKTTPNFTALSTALPIDWIVTQFVYEINRNSEYFQLGARYQGTDPVVAFAVGEANSGPAGAAAGVEIAALTAGTVVNVFVYNGVTRTITLTQEMVDSLQAAATDSSFTYILTSNLSEAGTTSGGSAYGMFIMALDNRTAYVDYIPQIKVRLRVSLMAGFDYQTVALTEPVKADEGQGYGRVLNLIYRATQGQRKYSQIHTEDPYINFSSPVVEDEEYVVYNILHGNSEQVDTFNVVYSPYREILCIPRYSTGTTANPLIAAFDSFMNAWLASSGNANIVTLD